MAIVAVKRPVNRSQLSVHSRPVQGGGIQKTAVCKFWVAGRCTKERCRFLHPDAQVPLTHKTHFVKRKALVWTKEGSTPPRSNEQNITQKNIAVQQSIPTQQNLDSQPTEPTHQIMAIQKIIDTHKPMATQKSMDKQQPVVTQKNKDAQQCIPTQKSIVPQKNNAIKKPTEKVCKFWADGSCGKGDGCQYMHTWFRGDGFSMLTKLQDHQKIVTGIVLPDGFNKLYSASKDGTVRVWDCHTGQCGGVVNLGGEAGSLYSKGPWVFAGAPNVVKAWNIVTNAEYSLNAPAGQVHAMEVGNELLFAGTQEGVILVYGDGSEGNPFGLATSLEGHTGAVVCLKVEANRLYSGSADHTIRVWDLNSLQCIMTLNGHSDVVTSLIFWRQFLISCSLDCTIKVWADKGNLEVTYTHTEEQGLLGLSGMVDADAKPILLCSSNDNSVRLFELPSFAERGRLFTKEEVGAIQVGPEGLFFSGDATGLLSVWKWTAPGPKVESSS